MATVHEIEQRLFSWAPRESAMDWDNVGHLVGDPEQEVERILVALDITERVVQEAIDCGAQLIVSHHPVMNVRWHEREMQTLRPDTRLGGVLTALVKNITAARPSEKSSAWLYVTGVISSPLMEMNPNLPRIFTRAM